MTRSQKTKIYDHKLTCDVRNGKLRASGSLSAQRIKTAHQDDIEFSDGDDEENNQQQPLSDIQMALTPSFVNLNPCQQVWPFIHHTVIHLNGNFLPLRSAVCLLLFSAVPGGRNKAKEL